MLTPQQHDQISKAAGLVFAVGDIIKAQGSIPSGHLYAILMPAMQLETYNQIIDILIESGKVKQQNYLLTWVE